ncbi:MAG: hypothetical protein IPL99_12260 [Candidatus Competibacteraceae bacterium]|nr:hypothetical protein [Candidatus Competibacteraceae bacterium]
MSSLIGKLAQYKMYSTGSWGLLYTCPPGKIACVDVSIASISIGATNGLASLYITPVAQTTRPDEDIIFCCMPASRTTNVARSILIRADFKISWVCTIGTLSTINFMVTGIEEDMQP